MEQDEYKVTRLKIIKLEENQTYQKYCNSLIQDISEEELDTLIELLINKAAINMGRENYEASDEAKASIIEFLYNEFPYLPLNYIASGILRGSLGKFGAGRLVPRTVRLWLSEVAQEYRNLQKHKELEGIAMNKDFIDLKKYPVGKAIIKKIEWWQEEKITLEDWDKISLKKLSEDIAERENINLKNYIK